VRYFAAPTSGLLPDLARIWCPRVILSVAYGYATGMTNPLDNNFGAADADAYLNDAEQPVSPDAYAGAPEYGTPVSSGAPVYGTPVSEAPVYGVVEEQGFAPIQAEPTPWGSEPRYGQYARGGEPGYGMAPLPSAPPIAYASKPGIIPLRPLRLGEIFDGAFGAVRANPAVMLGLSALVIGAATLIGVALGQLLARAIGPALNPLFNDAELNQVLNDFNIGTGLDGTLNAGFDLANTTSQLFGHSFGTGLTMLIASPILAGLLTLSVSQSVIGNKLSIGEVWGRVAPRIGALLAWTFLSAIVLFAAIFLAILLIVVISAAVASFSEGFAVLLGLGLGLALALVLIWISVKLLFVPVAIVLENASVGEAIRRSWRLSAGEFWRIFGIYLLAQILVGLVASLVTTPIGFLSGLVGAGGAWVVTTIITSIISTLITSIFMAGVISLLYIDARMRREGLGETLAASAQNSGAMAY